MRRCSRLRDRSNICAGAAKGALKSKRLLPSRFKVGKLTFRTRLFIVEPMSPSLQRPAHRGCRGGAPPRSFPGFSRARETGPPEAIPIGGKVTPPGRGLRKGRRPSTTASVPYLPLIRRLRRHLPPREGSPRGGDGVAMRRIYRPNAGVFSPSFSRPSQNPRNPGEDPREGPRPQAQFIGSCVDFPLSLQ